MKDPRIEKLAYNLIHHSVKLKKGEKVLIENFGLQTELVEALVKEAYNASGYLLFQLKSLKSIVLYCSVQVKSNMPYGFV